MPAVNELRAVFMDNNSEVGNMKWKMAYTLQQNLFRKYFVTK
jgi:hypothetical protein